MNLVTVSSEPAATQRRLGGCAVSDARVFIYSDETRRTTPDGRILIVAGVAISAHHNAIRRRLVEAEWSSRKDRLDWHRTTEQRRRRQYLESVFAIAELKTRVFFRLVPDTAPWDETVKSIRAAMDQYCEQKRIVIAHEGFTASARDKLRHELRNDPRLEEVRTGHFDKEPLIRLADALAGFFGLMALDHSPKADALRDLNPDWIRKLE